MNYQDENYIPSREDINGLWPRLIIMGESKKIYVEEMSAISWCTEWCDTIRSYNNYYYVTVHRVTLETMGNAYAAGFMNIPFMLENIQLHRLSLSVSRPDNLLTPCTYVLHGDCAEAARQYVIMYAACKGEDVRDIFPISPIPNELHLPGAEIKVYKKDEQDTEQECDMPQIQNAEDIRIYNDTTIEFYINNKKYVCRIDVETGYIDVDDFWPNRSGKLVDVLNQTIVYGAGNIIINPNIRFWEVYEGSWKETTMQESQQEVKNSERIIKYEKSDERKSLTMFRTYLHSACKEHMVIVPSSHPIGVKPLGMRTSFWHYLDVTESENNTSLDNYIIERRNCPYLNADNDDIKYGKILYLNRRSITFRQSQQAALQLMFRGNRLYSGIYILPCGAGKTLLGIAAAVRAAGKRTLVLVPNSTIQMQWKKRFFDRARVRAKSYKEIGRMNMSMMNPKINPNSIVAIVSWEKLAWKGSEGLALEGSRKDPLKIAAVENITFCHWDVVIIDEVHNIRTGTRRMDMLSNITYDSIIGLTATEDSGNKLPRYVEIAPIVYETAWPLEYVHIENIHCTPWLHDRLNESLDKIASETLNTNQTETGYKNRIYGELKSQLPTFMKNMDTYLTYNPKKLEAIAQLLESHESRNEPIIVFANEITYMEIFRRRFINFPIKYSHEEFGNYLRKTVKEYIFWHIHRKYLEALGHKLNITERHQLTRAHYDSYARWKETFVEEWNHNDHITNQRLLEICPNVPVDNMYAIHFMEQLENEEHALYKRIHGICKVHLREVTKVTQIQYGELFFLFDTPRWYMYGQINEYNVLDRSYVYEKFKRGHIKTLFLSRIGNEGVDLPNTRVIIIANGQGQKATEDAQRFGRTLRGVEENKEDRYLYEVFTDTGRKFNKDKDNALKREEFLKSRGYQIKKTVYEPSPDGETKMRDSAGVYEMLYSIQKQGFSVPDRTNFIDVYVDNTFFMTPEMILEYRQTNVIFILSTVVNKDAPTDFLIKIDQTTFFFRNDYEYENNSVMKKYIESELQINIW